jgi:hypothetical protein
MGRVRHLLGSSVAGLAGYAAARLLARPRWPGGIDSDLLGSARGTSRLIRGPRASTLYTEWFASGADVREEAGGPEEGAERPVHRGAIVFTHGWCVTEAMWHYQKLAFEDGRTPS